MKKIFYYIKRWWRRKTRKQRKILSRIFIISIILIMLGLCWLWSITPSQSIQGQSFDTFEEAQEAGEKIQGTEPDCDLSELPSEITTQLQGLETQMSDGYRTISWSECIWFAPRGKSSAIWLEINENTTSIDVVIIGLSDNVELNGALARKEVNGNMAGKLFSQYPSQVSKITWSTITDANGVLALQIGDQIILGVRYHEIAPEIFPEGLFQWDYQNPLTELEACQQFSAQRIMLSQNQIGYFQSQAERTLTENEMDYTLQRFCPDEYEILHELEIANSLEINQD